MNKLIEINNLKNNSNYKLAWLSSWNKEIDPPTYIFEGDISWMFKNQSKENINSYIMFEGLELPDDLKY